MVAVSERGRHWIFEGTPVSTTGVRHRTSGYGQASIARTVAQTFRRSFRIRNRPVNSHVEVSLLGQSRRCRDHRPTAAMISIADVEHTIRANDSFVRVQRTVVDPQGTVDRLESGPSVMKTWRQVSACRNRKRLRPVPRRQAVAAGSIVRDCPSWFDRKPVERRPSQRPS